MKKTKIGIIGGAGYTAGELVRILVNHPGAELSWVHSESSAGRKLYEVHGGLVGETDLRFCDSIDLESIDLVFLCGAHGKSGEFWAEHKAPAGLKIIDLAQDYRDESEGYVYGLPEWQRERIVGADKVANPGCYATAIQLSLLPLAASGLLKTEVCVNAATGSTGAGAKLSPGSHFSWRTDNLSTYKVFTHQHLLEIRRNLTALQGSEIGDINFIPMRGDFARGIFATSHLNCPLSEDEARALYKDFYTEAPFTIVGDSDVSPYLKQVVNTNKALICLEKHGDKLVITTAIDNLLKGASGQAVQNMNLMCGYDETAGLKLKASAF
ncbi:MAG: N-acetyl-gamma-glutamyl-phosphate reductase [Bacteroidales bacterium]|nr:N-acetyl-gamma-glutamyl-phosphate reductase [Bacteroidales bacterium]